LLLRTIFALHSGTSFVCYNVSGGIKSIQRELFAAVDIKRKMIDRSWEEYFNIIIFFRPGMVDLPLDTREAAVNAITLPEVFHDFDTARRNLVDLNLEDQLSISQVHY
jgi:hypothetical protein